MAGRQDPRKRMTDALKNTPAAFADLRIERREITHVVLRDDEGRECWFQRSDGRGCRTGRGGRGGGGGQKAGDWSGWMVAGWHGIESFWVEDYHRHSKDGV